MIFFRVFARVRACFRGYLPLNCHHDLRRKCPYLLGFLRARPLPIARPAPSNVRALWPQSSPPSRSNVTPWPLAWVPGRTSRRRPCRRTSRRRHDWPRAKMRRKGLAIPRVHPLDVAGGLFILSPSASRSPGRSSRPRTSRRRWQVPGANGCPVVLSVRRKTRAASPGGRRACFADST